MCRVTVANGFGRRGISCGLIVLSANPELPQVLSSGCCVRQKDCEEYSGPVAIFRQIGKAQIYRKKNDNNTIPSYRKFRNFPEKWGAKMDI